MASKKIKGRGSVIDHATIEEFKGPGIKLYRLKLSLINGPTIQDRKSYKKQSDAIKAAQSWIDSDAFGASMVFENFVRASEGEEHESSHDERATMLDKLIVSIFERELIRLASRVRESFSERGAYVTYPEALSEVLGDADRVKRELIKNFDLFPVFDSYKEDEELEKAVSQRYHELSKARVMTLLNTAISNRTRMARMSR